MQKRFEKRELKREGLEKRESEECVLKLISAKRV